jgi:acetyl esterase/lipase
MRKYVVCGLLSAACCLSAAAQTLTTVEYAKPAGKSLLMDLRVPDGNGPWPVILFLHSGAWISGDRTGGPAIRQVSRGYAVASIDYRLAPESTWPAQLDDCNEAIRWLRVHAVEYRLDPARIGVFGTSAGGHLAAVVGTTGEKVKAVVDLYGPTDLLKLEDQKLPCIPLNGNASFMPPSLLMGCPIQACREKTATASPMTYVTPDDPPFLILHGQRDCLVPWQQSQTLYDSLRASGVSATLHLLPTAEHADDQFNEPRWTAVVDEFLDTNLRGAVMARRRALR